MFDRPKARSHALGFSEGREAATDASSPAPPSDERGLSAMPSMRNAAWEAGDPGGDAAGGALPGTLRVLGGAAGRAPHHAEDVAKELRGGPAGSLQGSNIR
eukprot:6458827-Alexandrium_andersonii.AAC.1